MTDKRLNKNLESISVQFSHYTLLYLRMHSHQIESIWNRYKIGTDKPCAYMEPGRFAPDPSLTTIQFGTASNGTELYGTYVNTATDSVN